MPTLGYLVLHGFTSSIDSVNRVPMRMVPHNLPYRMPVLRGHGTRPEDMHGVTWHDWYSDAHAAFAELRREADKVVIVGLSMGGLLALHLAAAHPTEVEGVVTLGAALRFRDWRANYVRLIMRLVRMWGNEQRDMGYGWADPELGRRHTNYRRFPTRSLDSLVRYTRVVERVLPRVQAPLLVIHSRADRTILPTAAEFIHQQAGSAEKTLVWFERSGHEMLRDSEAEAVLERIEAFILARQAALKVSDLSAKE